MVDRRTYFGDWFTEDDMLSTIAGDSTASEIAARQAMASLLGLVQGLVEPTNVDAFFGKQLGKAMSNLEVLGVINGADKDDIIRGYMEDRVQLDKLRAQAEARDDAWEQG